MDNNYTRNNLETIFKSFQDMIKVETVVGEAVHIGDAILVPFVDVTFGFGSGGTNGKGDTACASAGCGGGAKMEPTAILVIKGERVEMFSIKQDGYHASGFEKLIAMAPEIIDKMKKISIFILTMKETPTKIPTRSRKIMKYNNINLLFRHNISHSIVFSGYFCYNELV